MGIDTEDVEAPPHFEYPAIYPYAYGMLVLYQTPQRRDRAEVDRWVLPASGDSSWSS